MSKTYNLQSVTREHFQNILDSLKKYKCDKINLMINDEKMYIQSIEDKNINLFLKLLDEKENDLLKQVKKMSLSYFRTLLTDRYNIYFELKNGNIFVLEGIKIDIKDNVKHVVCKRKSLIIKDVDYYSNVFPHFV